MHNLTGKEILAGQGVGFRAGEMIVLGSKPIRIRILGVATMTTREHIIRRPRWPKASLSNKRRRAQRRWRRAFPEE